MIEKKRVLVIVAHPDDETLWMGGMILQNDWDVTVISLCRSDDADRAPKFKKVCELLGVRGFISDLEDEELSDVSFDEVATRIRKFVNGEYDLVFTHGANGEYRHKRHKDVHFTVEKMVKDKEIDCKKVFFFDYRMDKRASAARGSLGSVCRANARADNFINLNEVTLKRKRELIKDVYGYPEDGFEFKSCGKAEAFKIWNIK